MISYKAGDDVGPLQSWPLDNPASAYVVRAGDPRTSGRIDAGGRGHKTRMGLWHCTVGTFDCTEQGDELMTILSGRCRLTDHASNVTYELGPNDSHFVTDGTRVTWEIVEDLTKVFFGYKREGY
ncbi:DUF861 domain-containing protein [Pseudohalocynthiibacter aestuariivivens]|nr:cupin domain-containing protein [Pseudohalocynthiibacter aestuariivivens]QIE46952.1 DUF861 domain-containing protein [Pseudohalocynthiibacter aestuariivivens]